MEPIIEKDGNFPPPPKLPESFALPDHETYLMEMPQCFFLRGKKKGGEDAPVGACPSLFLFLQLKDDSYMRLLSHATCQFYKLKTKTMAYKKCEKAIVAQLTKKSPFPAEMKFSKTVKVMSGGVCKCHESPYHLRTLLLQANLVE